MKKKEKATMELMFKRYVAVQYSGMYNMFVQGYQVMELTEIELEEHSITMNNNKATDTKTDNIYKITNATGKTYNFGEFRHL